MARSDYNIPVDISNRDEVMEVANDYDTDQTYFQTSIDAHLVQPEQMAARPGDKVLEAAEEDATLDIIAGEGVYTEPLELDIEDRDTHEAAMNEIMRQMRTSEDPLSVWGKIRYRSNEIQGESMPHDHPSGRYSGEAPSADPGSALEDLGFTGLEVRIRGNSTDPLGNPDIRDFGTYDTSAQELDFDRAYAARSDLHSAKRALEG